MLFVKDKIVAKINKEIAALALGNAPQELYDPIRYFMGLGGKRLRPFLTLFGAYIFSDDFEEAMKPALAIEVFHNFTLMHDDIMDKAPLRRNMPTVHEKWSNNIAILSGDVMLVKAYELLLHVEPKKITRVISAFNRCATEVCEGQQFDMNFEQIENVQIDAYLSMIRLKTAVLLGLCLEVGSIIGGAAEKDALLLKEAGESAGIAFQLMDDLLDVYGDQSKFGKQVGGDIVANKKTFLLINALHLAKGSDLKTLRSLLEDKNIAADEKVRKVTALYDKLGVRKIAEQKIDDYIVRALSKLNEASGSYFRKNQLKKYFLKLAKREN